MSDLQCFEVSVWCGKNNYGIDAVLKLSNLNAAIGTIKNCVWFVKLKLERKQNN